MSLCHLCKQVTRPKEIASDDSLEKNLKKSPSCIIHWKTDSLSDSLSLTYTANSKKLCYVQPKYLQCTLAIRQEAVGIKKRKSPQKRDDGRHFEIERWKEKKSCYFYCDLTARKRKSGKTQKKTSLHHPKSFSSSAEQQLFWLQHLWRESKICSKLFLDQKSNRHHYYPALKPPPRLPPSRKKIKTQDEKFVSDCDHYPLLFFLLLVFHFFFLKIVPTFFSSVLISRSVFSFTTLFSRLRNGGSVLIKPISDNTLFSNRSPIKTSKPTRYVGFNSKQK